MKTITRILTLLLVVSLFCSAMSMGASAAGATSTSTYMSITGTSGAVYYINYSQSGNYVGYGYTNATKPVKVVQARCVIANTFPTQSSSYIDGLFGSYTYSAICGYQGKYGLTTDGVVGYNTWKDMGYTHFVSTIYALL